MASKEEMSAPPEGTETASAIDLGVLWQPNAPDPLLIQTDHEAFLILEPYQDDQDRRLVVFEWVRCRGALLGGPNDEARSGHRSWQKGLSDCLWAAEVTNSAWLARLERENRVHHRHSAALFAGYRHFILMLKDSTFEVLAKSYQLHRWSRDQVVVQFPTVD